MSFDPDCPHPVPVVTCEPLIVTGTGHPFTFGPGHRMRRANCAVCHLAIGGLRVAVIGFADMDRDACTCGHITSCSLVVHAECSTDDDEKLTDLVRQYLSCEAQHP